jgi:hypothetical protein
MKRIIALATAVVALAAASLALAQVTSENTYEIKASSSPTTAGSKSKPVPISTSVSIVVGEKSGNRPATWKSLTTAYAGVRQNGDLFPKCTATQIANAQSDSGCPKGSLVGTGKLVGLIGPATDFTQPGVKCEKDIRVYNGGKGKESLLLVGPGSKCGGVSYNPPAPMTWSNSGGVAGGQSVKLPIPSNIAHPLPGVTGSVGESVIKYKKVTVKKGGKTRGYLESVGCKSGKRAYTVTILEDPAKTFKENGSTGSCK